jgi:hypothetical protein
MDDDDYSWVRRTRFSHSAVRSNSGREQFGAFVEQFNRGAALRQKGAASGFKLHGLNMESGTRHSTSSNPGTSSLKGSSSDAKLRQHEKAGDRPLLQLQERSAKQGSGKDANGRKACGNLSVAVHREPAESPENETPGALEFSFHPDDQSMSLHRACSSPAPFPGKKTPGDEAMVRSSSLTALNQGPRLEQRARSPLPSRDVPEAFKEAKSSSKRFSTPPPRRRSLSPGPRDGIPHVAFPPERAPGKLKQRKQCVAAGRAKVAALEVLDKWSVDRSQLLIGHRFASRAHSRLFHGIYKGQPVAVKFIRQPEDEEDAELAAQLEKQFNTEVATLSRLNHPNVIKVTSWLSIS